MGAATDAFGQPLTAHQPRSVALWDEAFAALIGFTGDPLALLAEANATDPAFVMGPVFTATYNLLGGANPADPAVVNDIDRTQRRLDTATPRERGHAAAVALLHSGEFLRAAEAWDAVTQMWPKDLSAYRFVHDICLHIGDDSLRLPAARRAVEAFESGTRAHGLAAGMLAFALEEVGDYDDAERWGLVALRQDPSDLWARHALAHVYESVRDHESAMDLLVPTNGLWSQQNLLSNHVWWHVGLRLLEHGDVGGAVGVLDDRLGSTTPFGLADSTSLLWRLQLAGVESPERWQPLREHWARNGARHTCGFLDLHTALAFAAEADNPAALRFWNGVALSHSGGDTYNDITFNETVRPLADGVRAFAAGDAAAASELLGGVLASLHRIGGSVVQRDIVNRTLSAARRAS